MNRSIELEILEQHDKVTFYTFRFVDDELFEFDKFYDAHDNVTFREEMDFIIKWIDKIGEDGAIDRFFRPEKGKMMAIPLEITDIRLYCFKISDDIVIIGNGGIKKTKTYNEDPLLNSYAENLLSIGKILIDQINRGIVTIHNKTLYGLKPISFNSI